MITVHFHEACMNQISIWGRTQIYIFMYIPVKVSDLPLCNTFKNFLPIYRKNYDSFPLGFAVFWSAFFFCFISRSRIFLSNEDIKCVFVFHSKLTCSPLLFVYRSFEKTKHCIISLWYYGIFIQDLCLQFILTALLIQCE